MAWACNLFSDILGHYAKRNGDAIGRYDPSRLDTGALMALFDDYATGRVRQQRDRLPYGLNMLSEPEDDGAMIDEFASAAITGPDDVLDIFTRQFHFGCEADDPMNAMAFNQGVNPLGARLRGVFASDIGHWDVPDFRQVLPEAYELVTEGHLSEDDFKAFVFDNPVSLWAGGNARFFAGTVVEAAVDKHLAG